MEACLRVAEAMACAVCVMPDAKGAFPEDHELFIGVYWGVVSSPICQEIVESADVILCIAPVFSDYTTVGHTAMPQSEKTIIVYRNSVDVTSETFPKIALVPFLDTFASFVTPNPTTMKSFKGLREKPSSTYSPSANERKGPLRTTRLYKHIQDLLEKNTSLLVETGDSWFNAMELTLPRGAEFHIQMTYGSIGWSLGAMLGLAAAQPSRKHILLIGDGSFQMTAQEMSTIMRFGYKGLIVLLNNDGYVIEIKIHDGPYNNIQHWNYTDLVNAWKGREGKGKAWKVETEEELETALVEVAEFDGLAFVEAVLDKNNCNPKLLRWAAKVAEYNSKPPQASE